MKRILDLVLIFLAAPVWIPTLGILMLVTRISLGRPVLFRQLRPGRDGKGFELIKLRTMTGERDTTGALLRDEQRLTRFGKWLRATSLDELPELWNVLKGDMSLVGPRPLLMEYLALYTVTQARRHAVRPGISGWAQINGRNAIDWKKKFELDVWYVENRTLQLDLRILWLTVIRVFQRKGISASGDATMPKFTGNEE